VPVHLHVVPAFDDLAVRTDEEGGAGDAHELPPVKRLLLPDPVRFGDVVVGVGEQRELEPVLLGEPGLARGVEDRHAEHRRLGLAEFWEMVPEVARLLGTAGRVVLRIEVQDQWLPRVVLEAVNRARLILERERRGLVAGIGGRHGLCIMPR
jgi:hypothetical protein